MTLTPDLIAKYENQRVPRYTSYPTAPHFGSAVDGRTYAGWLEELPATALGSLYLHVPFCREMCTYCGCHTRIVRDDAPIAAYAATLRAEIAAVAGRLPGRLAVAHVHFGGGTPTLLAPGDFAEVTALLRARFAIRDDAEIAVEIDPRTLSRAMTATLGRAGVTRASLGVQSFDADVQRAINREQSFAETQTACRGLREAGVGGINLDLIYGLPLQTVASCRDTVLRALDLMPDRLSVFGYAHVPSIRPHQGRIDVATLPGAAARLDQQQAIAEELAAAGYVAIGFDHYARPGDAMALALAAGTLHRNFQGYTTDAADLLLGFGTSAIGRLPQGYAQNTTSIRDWRAAIEAGGLPIARGRALSADDRLRAEIIESLLCRFAVDLNAVTAAHGFAADWLDAALPRLAPLAADGLALVDGRRVVVTPSGRPLARCVAAVFDAYLKPEENRHAKAI